MNWCFTPPAAKAISQRGKQPCKQMPHATREREACPRREVKPGQSTFAVLALTVGPPDRPTCKETAIQKKPHKRLFLTPITDISEYHTRYMLQDSKLKALSKAILQNLYTPEIRLQTTSLVIKTSGKL